MLIGEIVARTGLSKDGIRYYESLGLIHSKPVSAGTRTYRHYDDTTLERIALIALAKRLNFSLKEMVEPLDQLLSDTISIEEKRAILLSKLKDIDEKILQLKSVRKQILEIAKTPEKPFVDEILKKLGIWFE